MKFSVYPPKPIKAATFMYRKPISKKKSQDGAVCAECRLHVQVRKGVGGQRVDHGLFGTSFPNPVVSIILLLLLFILFIYSMGYVRFLLILLFIVHW